MIQKRNPSKSIARPAVKKTYDGVHRILLIGISHQLSRQPMIRTGTPMASSPAARSTGGRSFLSESPTRMPSSVVQIAGMVDSRPSLSG